MSIKMQAKESEAQLTTPAARAREQMQWQGKPTSDAHAHSNLLQQSDRACVSLDLMMQCKEQETGCKG